MTKMTNKNSIFFIRTDASSCIGSGHVMRCLTIAEQLRKRDFEVIFICRELPGNMIEHIESNNFQVEKLTLPDSFSTTEYEADRNWLGVPQSLDISETVPLLKKHQRGHLIVDHYSIDRQWHSAARPFVNKIIVIDDLANRHHDCDMLLDQTFAILPDRYDQLVPDDCVVLTGTDYAILREDFPLKRAKTLCNRQKRDRISNILISFGGVDQQNITLLSLKACEKFYPANKFKIQLVIGSANPHKSKLLEFIKLSQQDITLHVNTKQMSDLMANADLALGAGGTTSWERCTLGLPSIVVCLADNQRKLIKNLSDHGAIYDIGNATDLTEKHIVTAMKKIINGTDMLKNMAVAASTVCDGSGTRKFVSSLQEKLAI